MTRISCGHGMIIPGRSYSNDKHAWPSQCRKGLVHGESLVSACSPQQDLPSILVFLCNIKVPSFKLSFVCHWAGGESTESRNGGDGHLRILR